MIVEDEITQTFKRATASLNYRVAKAIKDGYRMANCWDNEQSKKGDDVITFGMITFWRPRKEV